MPRFQFERELRTPHSESFVVSDGDGVIGRVDVHYGSDIASATMCVPEDFSENDIQELIAEADERLVTTAQPFREDFVVTVWLGRQAGIYSEEMDDELDEELEGNGHKE